MKYFGYVKTPIFLLNLSCDQTVLFDEPFLFDENHSPVCYINSSARAMLSQFSFDYSIIQQKGKRKIEFSCKK